MTSQLHQYFCRRCAYERDGLLDHEDGIGGYSWACPKCGSCDVGSRAVRQSLEHLMAHMPDKWKRQWCLAPEFGSCGCLGCANHSGGLLREGFTYDDWRQYLKERLGLSNIDTLEEARAKMGAMQSRIDAFWASRNLPGKQL